MAMLRRSTLSVVLLLVCGLGMGAPGDTVLKINNPQPLALDQFGYDLAVSKTDLVIGAPNDSTSLVPDGSGSVFFYSAKTLEFRGRIDGQALDTFTSFGAALAIGGKNALIGEPQADIGAAVDAGFAYLTSLKTLTHIRPFNNPAPTIQDYFGQDVAATSRLFAISAPGDDTVTTNAGTVYVFEQGTSVPIRFLFPPSLSQNQEFGRALAFVKNTIAVGAPGQIGPSAAQDAGMVHLYDSRSGGFLGFITEPTRRPGARFGAALAGSKKQLAVGAPGSATSGTVYLFNPKDVSVPIVVPNPTPAFGDDFGYAVAFVGTKYLLVGAPGDDTGGVDAGAAYVFDAKTGGLLLTVINPESNPADRFGASVASDGKSLFIGAPGDTVTAQPQAGSVFVIEGP